MAGFYLREYRKKLLLRLIYFVIHVYDICIPIIAIGSNHIRKTQMSYSNAHSNHPNVIFMLTKLIVRRRYKDNRKKYKYVEIKLQNCEKLMDKTH